jgi:CRP-like cAMP-binding protein
MALERDLQAMQEVALLAALQPEALRLLAFAAETKMYRAGDILFQGSRPPGGGQFLTRGSLACFSNADQIGAPERIVHAPALIGEMALLCETDVPGSIVAREPSSALFMSRALFQRVLREYPDSARRIEQFLRARIATTAQGLTPFLQGLSVEDSGA